jgi:AcrR family transcriptional regulator
MNNTSCFESHGAPGWQKMKKTTRKEREKRRHSEEILYAAENVFAEKGYVHAKMSDIAEAAEFSVGYIYNIWKSKEDLYLSILDSKMKDFGAFIEGEIAKTDDPYEKIDRLIDAHFTFFEEHRAFYKIYISEEAQSDIRIFNAFGRRLKQHKAELFQKVEEIFRKGIASGVFISVPAEDLTTAMKGIMFAFTMDLLNRESLQNYSEKKDIIKKIFFESVLRNSTKTTDGLEVT